MINSKFFTKDEQAILRSLPIQFKWIARDGNRRLFVYEDKPKMLGTEYVCKDGYKFTDVTFLGIFGHIFKGVTFRTSPICFRAEVLDEVEKAYLKAVLKPFKKRIAYVKKVNMERGGVQYIRVMLKNCDWMAFPAFQAGTMYKGMTVGEKYSLQDLGIRYE